MLKARFLKKDEVSSENPLRAWDMIMKAGDYSDLIRIINHSSTDNILLSDIRQGYDDNNHAISVAHGDRGTGEISLSKACDYAVLPAISFDDMSDILINKNSNVIDIGDGLKEIQYGYYPYEIINRSDAKKLMKEVDTKTDKGPAYYSDEKRQMKRMTACTFKGDSFKYCYFPINDVVSFRRGVFGYSKKIGENGRDLERLEFYEGDAVLFKCKPVKWILDEKAKVIVAKGPITMGIPVTSFKTNNPSGLEDSNLGTFLNKIMSDMTSGVELEFLEDRYQEKKEGAFTPQKKVLYDLEPPRNLSEDEKIEYYIRAKIPIMLHGYSGVGKTGRIKSIDPNPQIVSLFNKSKEEILGITVYDKDTGQVIFKKPNWLENIERKCKEKSDKPHILFLDEITLGEQEDIQKAAYEILLERTVRDGMWELPPEVSIAAAGNDENESSIAQNLPKPLFSRLAHIYVTTTPEQWIKWASTAGIHPAVISYIAYKRSMGENMLRTKYTGETPYADPRRWEMASKLLIKTKLPEALGPTLGDDITRDFIEFVRTPVYPLEDVLEHPFEMRRELKKVSFDERYQTLFGFTQVDEEHVKEVREIIKVWGPEYVALFDNIWIGDSREREDRIMQIKETEKLPEEFYQE
ncbi:MAG: hypothetical protein K6D97_02665 [Clostridia bacterium]|nr:hypothetical protein [Clostridia bacterium]